MVWYVWFGSSVIITQSFISFHFEVIFILRLSSFWCCLPHFKVLLFWGCLDVEVIFILRFLIWFFLDFEVVFILRSSSFGGRPYLRVILILRLSSFWGCLHLAVAINLRLASILGCIDFEVIFIMRMSSFWDCLHFEDFFIWCGFYFEDSFTLKVLRKKNCIKILSKTSDQKS